MIRGCAKHLFWLTSCLLLVVSTAEVDDSVSINAAPSPLPSATTPRTPSSTVNSTSTVPPLTSSTTRGDHSAHRNHHGDETFTSAIINHTIPSSSQDRHVLSSASLDSHALPSASHGNQSDLYTDYTYEYYDDDEIGEALNSPRVSASKAGGGSGNGLYEDDEDELYDYYDYEDGDYYDDYYDGTSTPDYGDSGSDIGGAGKAPVPGGNESRDGAVSYDDTYDDYGDETSDDYDDGLYDDNEGYYDGETGDETDDTDDPVLNVGGADDQFDLSGIDENVDTFADDTDQASDEENSEFDDVGDDRLGKEPFEGSSFLERPGMLAAIIGGAVVGLFCAILLVMLIVYRVRKKDEGSYMLDEPKRSLTGNGVSRNYNKEFYA